MKVNSVIIHRRSWFAVAALLALSLLVASAHADTFTIGTPGTGLSASADFSWTSAGKLQVVLTNLGAEPVFNTDALGGLFFDLPDGVVLDPVSATVTAGSHVYNYTSPVTDISPEWAYRSGLNYNGTDAGISAVGYGLFEPSNRFSNGNVSGSVPLDGADWSIISTDPTSPQGQGNLNDPLVANSVTFVFDPNRLFELSDIGLVGFQYGTDLEGGWKPVPEPATMGMLALGLGGLGALARRRKTRRS
jgi:hypothetical protein